MTDRLAELGALQYAVENLSTAGTSPNRLALAGYIHAAYTDYQTWAAANPGVNPNRLSARGRLYGYFYDNASWSPLSLFASSEVGAWYDPSDLTTMFQDRSGTTPVTADGQTVGLILDKSNGLALGSEFITNAADREFSSDTGFWSKEGSATISGGVVNINNAAGTAPIYKFNFPNETGGYYEISFDVTLTSGVLEVIFSTAPVAVPAGNGRKTLRIYRSSVSTFGIRANSAGGTAVGTIDNLTIKRISGNHAVAPSDAARPLKTSTGLSKWINYDAVDDVLNSTFPSSLGSSCTVARANVGSSPTILTSQTINTSYADSTDNAGLIIINRALTTQETTDLTAWLTAKGATS